MDKRYKKLLNNTALFTISTFASKVLSIIIKPLLSYWLTDPSLLGVTNLVTQAGNLLIPVVGLGISNAIIRYGLEKTTDKRSLFTNGLLAVVIGTAVMGLFAPLLLWIPDVKEYAGWLYLFVPISCLRTLCCQFTRAREHNKLYALDGVLCTATTFLFFFIYLSVLNLGPVGYILGMISADFCSTVFLTITGRLWRFVRVKRFDKALFGKMLRYAVPLIPASMFWWITNVSDQFFVSYMLEDGLYWNGLYTQSYVLPTLMTIISTIFTEAWQISAFTDGMGEDREKFYSRVFHAYQSVIFMAAAFIVAAAKPYCAVLSSEYRGAWRFIPVLAIAMVFASFNNFMNSIYMAIKRSGLSFATMAVGAVSNLVLNYFFIPVWGVNGAALATFISYFVVFVLRVINTRSLIRVEFAWGKMALNLALLTGMSYALFKWPFWVVALLGAAVVALNMRGMVLTAKNILQRKRGAK